MDMQQSFISVPFKAESGLSQVNGVAKFSGAGVVLEFESKLFGIIGVGVKEVKLAKEEILDLKFRKGILKRGAKIEIRTRTFAMLAQLPNKDGKLTLKLLPEDYDRALKAVRRLHRAIGEHPDTSMPPHSPVSRLFEDETDDQTKGLQHPEE
jgi:hypothetical protein